MVFALRSAATGFAAAGVRLMRIRLLAVLVVVAVSAAVFVEMRKDNRADAAASNCYSDAQGPSAPTICN
jgi:predicted exporter